MTNNVQKTVSQLAIEKEFVDFQKQNNVLKIVSEAKKNAQLLQAAADKFSRIVVRIKGSVAEVDFAFADMDMEDLKRNFKIIEAFNDMLDESDLFQEVKEEFENNEDDVFVIPEELELGSQKTEQVSE